VVSLIASMRLRSGIRSTALSLIESGKSVERLDKGGGGEFRTEGRIDRQRAFAEFLGFVVAPLAAVTLSQLGELPKT
jgi:hypothetical protein